MLGRETVAHFFFLPSCSLFPYTSFLSAFQFYFRVIICLLALIRLRGTIKVMVVFYFLMRTTNDYGDYDGDYGEDNDND